MRSSRETLRIDRRVAGSRLALGLVVMLAGAGCTPERDPNELFAPGDVDVLVIDARLIVGQPIPPLRLSRTLPPAEPFTPERSGVVDATISLRSSAGDTVFYRGVNGQPGVYAPSVAAPPVVAPETVYDLEVTTVEGERLSAQTTTPAPFNVASWVLLDTQGTSELRELRTFNELGDDVYDAPENQLVYSVGILEARFAEAPVDGYQLALFSLDLDSDFVIDPPFFEEEDFAELERTGSSPALSAENGTLRLPWFAVYFEGRHLYRIYAVDRNWYDLLRSSRLGDSGLRFGGNVGDDFERPIFNVAGGIGLFGSAAGDSVGFYVRPLQ